MIFLGLVAAQAADFMSVVKLWTALSISRFDFNLIFRLTCWIKIFWNCKQSVKDENNLGDSVEITGFRDIK